MASVSKEHLIRGSDPSLWGLGGLDGDDQTQRCSYRIWSFVNSKLLNALIVSLCAIQTLVILGLILIEYNLINDPSWSIKDSNCTKVNLNVTPNSSPYSSSSQSISSVLSSSLPSSLPSHPPSINSSSNIICPSKSPKLELAKVIFLYINLFIATIFLIEICLRFFGGRLKLFVLPFELADIVATTLIVVLCYYYYVLTKRNLKSSSIAPSVDDDLDLEAQSNDDVKQHNYGHELILTLMIVLARLCWRIYCVVQLGVEESVSRLSQILHITEKEKTHAEHKVDVLILKVEDLEHEVAYLKEKLKRTEKESHAALKELMKESGLKNANGNDGRESGNKNSKNHGDNSKDKARRTASNYSSASTATTSFCPCRRNSLQSQYQQYLMLGSSYNTDNHQHHNDHSSIVIEPQIHTHESHSNSESEELRSTSFILNEVVVISNNNSSRTSPQISHMLQSANEEEEEEESQSHDLSQESPSHTQEEEISLSNHSINNSINLDDFAIKLASSITHDGIKNVIMSCNNTNRRDSCYSTNNNSNNNSNFSSSRPSLSFQSNTFKCLSQQISFNDDDHSHDHDMSSSGFNSHATDLDHSNNTSPASNINENNIMLNVVGNINVSPNTNPFISIEPTNSSSSSSQVLSPSSPMTTISSTSTSISIPLTNHESSSQKSFLAYTQSPVYDQSLDHDLDRDHSPNHSINSCYVIAAHELNMNASVSRTSTGIVDDQLERVAKDIEQRMKMKKKDLNDESDIPLSSL